MKDGKLTEAERALLPSAQFEAEHERVQLANIRMALNGEQARIAFIRGAARQLFTYYTDEDGEPPVTAPRCWQLAAALWDAKPEDC